MSRSAIILILILILLTGLAFILANIDTSVLPTRVEKPVAINAVA